MKKLSPVLAGCLLGMCCAATAATYECVNNRGHRTYTSIPSPNCRAVNLGSVTTYPARVPSSSDGRAAYDAGNADVSQSVPSATNDSAVADNQKNAAERLRQAQQNLEEGRKVRYGNERNYARYLERIQKLEEEVSKAQQEMDSLNK